MNNCVDNITSNTGTMSWFVVSVIILGLWKYDRCLLDKLQRYLWSTTKSMGWSVFKVYAEYKDRNEMIKDGYHVDSVFLFEKQSPSFSRKLDVLRVFRSLIVDEAFSNKKSLSVKEFLELCSDPETNFQYNSGFEYELEVNYTFDRRQYKIVYDTDVNLDIRFPVYSESEIVKSGVDNSIISASIVRRESDPNGIDIGDVILKYAGPLGNFYDDSEYVVKRKWLTFSGIDNKSKIKIMDIDGNEYVFKEDEDYLTLKKKSEE